MDVEDWQLSWIVCHRATRSVSRYLVECPLRERVDGATCLACRFLMTSSAEREGPWCEVPLSGFERPPRPVRRQPPQVPLRQPIPIEVPLRQPVPVLLPHAVGPGLAVPSGHGIRT